MHNIKINSESEYEYELKKDIKKWSRKFTNTEWFNSKEIEQNHSTINTILPFRTDIKVEIRTLVDTPIWSKQYPYFFSANKCFNKEIDRMLKDGIIRPSKGLYNSSIWIVPKKDLMKTEHLNKD